MIASWVCFVACSVLVVAEYRGMAWLRIASKLVASLAFVVLAIPAIDGSAFARWLADAGWLALPPTAVGLAILASLWSRLGSLRVPVIVYVGAIVTMVIAALAAYCGGALPAPQRGWLAAGAVVFLVSDVAVARDRFVGREFSNKLWGLPAYYTAQVLIAWAAISS